MSCTPFVSWSAYTRSWGVVDGLGVRLLGRSRVVPSDAPYICEPGAIADVVKHIAARLTSIDVESP
jgi:hypothetical protein